MKIIKLICFLSIICTVGFSDLLDQEGQTLNVRLISGSTFIDQHYLLDGDYQSCAQLPFPDANNQFLIFDLAEIVSVRKINIYLEKQLQLIAKDLQVFLGREIIGGDKIDFEVKPAKDLLTVLPSEQAPSGRYLKLIFTKKYSYEPLKINEIEIFSARQKQEIYDVLIDQITTSSAIISYQTKTPADTYLLYGNNFDFHYESKIEQIYSDLPLKQKHAVRLQNLLPGTTYIFRIGFDDNNRKKLSKYYYFSTKRLK